MLYTDKFLMSERLILLLFHFCTKLYHFFCPLIELIESLGLCVTSAKLRDAGNKRAVVILCYYDSEAVDLHKESIPKFGMVGNTGLEPVTLRM